MFRELRRKLMPRILARFEEAMKPDKPLANIVWEASKVWESRYTFEWDHKDSECPDQPARMEQAQGLAKSDPIGALEVYRKAAQDGSVWSMWMVGWHYDKGCAVSKNPGLAEQNYRIAIRSGSMRATIDCAKLLKGQGRIDEALELLEPAAERGFVPAMFWKAYYAYLRDLSRDVARQIEPCLERAIDAGHPQARFFRNWLRMKGKFGIRQIPLGWRDWWKQLREHQEASELRESDESPSPAA